MNASRRSNPRRRGERVGWIGGGLGACLWMALAAGWWIAVGRWTTGIIMGALFAANAASLFLFAPWRFPRTPFWKLLIPIYLLFVSAVGFGYVSLDPASRSEIRPASLLPALGVFLPFFTVGGKRWIDGEPEEDE